MKVSKEKGQKLTNEIRRELDAVTKFMFNFVEKNPDLQKSVIDAVKNMFGKAGV